MFTRNYFIRSFVTDDLLKRTRFMCLQYMNDPTTIGVLRGLMNDASRDLILMDSTLEYLIESIGESFDAPKGSEGSELYGILDVVNLHYDIRLRCLDLEKLVRGMRNEMSNLDSMVNVINVKVGVSCCASFCTLSLCLGAGRVWERGVCGSVDRAVLSCCG